MHSECVWSLFTIKDQILSLSFSQGTFQSEKAAKSLLREIFPFWVIFSGSTSGVARGSCGVDLVCLPLEATTERLESPVDSHQWSLQVHS
jgi:hypothetical protein